MRGDRAHDRPIGLEPDPDEIMNGNEHRKSNRQTRPRSITPGTE